MFNLNRELRSIDVSSFDTSKVKNMWRMSAMFYGTSNLTN